MALTPLDTELDTELDAALTPALNLDVASAMLLDTCVVARPGREEIVESELVNFDLVSDNKVLGSFRTAGTFETGSDGHSPAYRRLHRDSGVEAAFGASALGGTAAV
jgi:hypothetical protein